MTAPCKCKFAKLKKGAGQPPRPAAASASLSGPARVAARVVAASARRYRRWQPAAPSGRPSPPEVQQAVTSSL